MKLSQIRSWRTGRILGDRFVTSSFVRWTWTGLSGASYSAVLNDFRPTDSETVAEMLRGRYLLASQLVDSEGASPFAVSDAGEAWTDELHGFSWLRHFRDASDETGRRLARTLVLDWIARHGNFERSTWRLSLVCQRVMNWLRHFALIVEGASVQEIETVNRSINLQVQSARLRAGLAFDPLDELMARIVVLGAALSDTGGEKNIVDGTQKLCDAIEMQIGRDGLHRSRNAMVQVNILVELVTLRQALAQRGQNHVKRLGEIVDRMLLALSGLMLGTGEAGYFNGSGQISTDILLALLLQGGIRRSGNMLTGGYGVIGQGDSVVMFDSGRVPDPVFSHEAHASALAFEFSHGNQLIVGNCGPAPASLPDHKAAFRQGVAHSAPTIEGQSSARLARDGALYSFGDKPYIEVSRDEATILGRTSGFRSRFGVQIERQVSLISDGETLVGRDRMIVPGHRRMTGNLTLSFHLGPGIEIEQSPDVETVRLIVRQKGVWNFLWEGADLRIDESVRQSAHVGLHRTWQLVLTCPLKADGEIAWIFTKQTN